MVRSGKIRRTISEQRENLQHQLLVAENAVARVRLEIQLLQRECPHANQVNWTNNDGDGQFRVYKCNDCGLQKDGSL